MRIVRLISKYVYYSYSNTASSIKGSFLRKTSANKIDWHNKSVFLDPGGIFPRTLYRDYITNLGGKLVTKEENADIFVYCTDQLDKVFFTNNQTNPGDVFFGDSYKEKVDFYENLKVPIKVLGHDLTGYILSKNDKILDKDNFDLFMNMIANNNDKVVTNLMYSYKNDLNNLYYLALICYLQNTNSVKNKALFQLFYEKSVFNEGADNIYKDCLKIRTSLRRRTSLNAKHVLTIVLRELGRGFSIYDIIANDKYPNTNASQVIAESELIDIDYHVGSSVKYVNQLVHELINISKYTDNDKYIEFKKAVTKRLSEE